MMSRFENLDTWPHLPDDEFCSPSVAKLYHGLLDHVPSHEVQPGTDEHIHSPLSRPNQSRD